VQYDLDQVGDIVLSDPSIDNEDEYYEEYLQLDEDLPSPVPPELVQALPTSKFTELNKLNFSEENKYCTICQSNYEVGEQYLMLMCLHRFHQPCVSEWFKLKDTCPICKEQVAI